MKLFRIDSDQNYSISPWISIVSYTLNFLQWNFTPREWKYNHPWEKVRIFHFLKKSDSFHFFEVKIHSRSENCHSFQKVKDGLYFQCKENKIIAIGIHSKQFHNTCSKYEYLSWNKSYWIPIEIIPFSLENTIEI